MLDLKLLTSKLAHLYKIPYSYTTGDVLDMLSFSSVTPKVVVTKVPCPECYGNGYLPDMDENTGKRVYFDCSFCDSQGEVGKERLRDHKERWAKK